MAYHLPSYKPCDDYDCHHGNDPAEPCYGKVTNTDEQCTEDYSDCWDIYQCEGHALCHTFYCWDGYKPSAYPEDIGVTVIEDDR